VKECTNLDKYRDAEVLRGDRMFGNSREPTH